MTWAAAVASLTTATRLLVLAVVSAASMVALTHWAVRQRHLSAFGALPRTVRRLSDPVLRPLERRLVRWGRNPQDASLWLVGLSVGAGILLLTLVDWTTDGIAQLLLVRRAGPRALTQFVITVVTQVLMLAILVRVIGSWVGAGEYTRWMRPFVWLTEWLIGPIRRRLPSMGPLDLSPIVAYFALALLRAFLFFLIP